MKRVLGRRGVAAAIVVVAGITVGGIAYASIPDCERSDSRLLPEEQRQPARYRHQQREGLFDE